MRKTKSSWPKVLWLIQEPHQIIPCQKVHLHPAICNQVILGIKCIIQKLSLAVCRNTYWKISSYDQITRYVSFRWCMYSAFLSILVYRKSYKHERWQNNFQLLSASEPFSVSELQGENQSIFTESKTVKCDVTFWLCHMCSMSDKLI